jgi:hypothetical protein
VSGAGGDVGGRAGQNGTVPALLRPAALGGLAVGVAAAGLAGLPALGVGAVAGAGWLAGGAMSAAARRARGRSRGHGHHPAVVPAVNPYAVPQPWRDLLVDVLRSQQKFVETAAAGPPGPLQLRLSLLGERVDAGVHECWLIAQRGAALNQAVARLDPGEIRRRLAIVESQPAGASHGETVAAVRAQLASVQRIEDLAEETRERLQLLAARLGEAVAEAVELSVIPDPAGVPGLDAVAAGMDPVVSELQALRAALADTDRAIDLTQAGPGTPAADPASRQPPG